MSEKFHWVYVDRDRAPELPKRFSVSAYPSLLVLGREAENVYRFSGFKKPAEFLPELAKGLQCHELYTKGEEWDAKPPRPPKICDAGSVRTIPAPSEDVPSGLAFAGDRLWVAQGSKLCEISPATGEVLRRIELSATVRGLASDGDKIYAVEYGWTAGKPIHVVDGKTGAKVGEIVTEANKKNRAYSAAGIAWKDGKLWVLAYGGKLHEVDPATGETGQVITLESARATGLDFDGTSFVTGGAEGIAFLDPRNGEVRRRVPTHYPVRSAACQGATVYLMEQPIFGFDRAHRRIRVWPETTVIHVVELPAPAEHDGGRRATGGHRPEAPPAESAAIR